MNIQRTPVVYRKIQRHAAKDEFLLGLAWPTNVIEIDERLKGYEKFYALVHEFTHIQYPKWSETRVKKHSKSLAWFIWRNMPKSMRDKW
jgi:hypothetical protein